MTDTLTIAYLAIGAHRALRETPMTVEVCDRYEGEIGFIGTVIHWETMLTEMFSRIAEAGEVEGVVDYEVSEPFGYHVAMVMLKARGPLAEAEGREYAKALFETITTQKTVSPLEQAFQNFDAAWEAYDGDLAELENARNRFEAASKNMIDARKSLWALMPKQQTFVRGDKAYMAPSTSSTEINVTKAVNL